MEVFIFYQLQESSFGEDKAAFLEILDQLFFCLVSCNERMGMMS